MNYPSILVIGTDVSEINALLDSDFKVETGSSLSDVAQIAREMQFSVVFVQLNVPYMLDYITKLRRTSRNRTTPLIGLIERDQQNKYDEIACLKADITDYRALPVVPDSLKLVMKRWIV